jgi:hypothetical protein
MAQTLSHGFEYWTSGRYFQLGQNFERQKYLQRARWPSAGHPSTICMTRINGPSQRRRGFIYVRCVSTVIDIKIDVPLMYDNVLCMEMCKGGDFYRRPVSAE